MKKKIATLLILSIMIVACLCSSSCLWLQYTKFIDCKFKYYEGYVYTITGNPVPVPDVRVYPDCDIFNCTGIDSAGGLTDENGYFKFERPQKRRIGERLFFESEKNIIDSFRVQYLGGHGNICCYFIQGKADTLFIDLDGEREPFTVHQGEIRPEWGNCPGIGINTCGSVNPVDSFTDSRDDRTYKTVEIGDYRWMAENLKFETDSSWCYHDSVSHCEKYGRLYAWNAAMVACPAGWRLPTSDEWSNLVEIAGGDSIAGTVLKSKTGWKDMWWRGCSGNGTDCHGFSALPGGRYCPSCGSYRGYFNEIGEEGYWWTSTESTVKSSAHSWIMFVTPKMYEKKAPSYGKEWGLSVRCIQDVR